MAEKNNANETRPRGTMRFAGRVLTFAFAILLLSACGGVTPVPTAAPTSAPTLPPAPTSTPRPEWTTPHPILSDVRVRRAIAYCTDKDALIESVYPYLTPEQRESLVMDSFLPREHWAYAGEENIEAYSFDEVKGKQLLKEAGWTVRDLGEIRVNEKGDQLKLKLEPISTIFDQAWTDVWIEQMKECGILIEYRSLTIIEQEARDFELQTFTWYTQADPLVEMLYACDQIPLVENGWRGHNYSGWCNPHADENIIRASHAYWPQEQIDAYRIVQQEFTKDMVNLPLFNLADTFAMNPQLLGLEIPTGDRYYSTWNIANWQIPERDSITIGFTQEPKSLFSIVEIDYVTNRVASMIEGDRYTSQNYEFMPVMQKRLPTLENGLVINNIVQIQEGDRILGDNGSWIFVGELKPGMSYWDVNGKPTEYKGGVITTNQLTIEYEFAAGLTWSDGVPVTKTDFELYYKIACAKDSGSRFPFTCDGIQNIEFNDNGYIISWIPGWQDRYYSLAPFGFYPAHRVLSDGRLLADLPTKEWATTPEVTHNPIGAGPYVLKEWIRGKQMIFEANPYFYGGAPKTKTIIIKFLSPAMAEPSLIVGDIDFLGSETLAGISESLLAAEQEGLIRIVVVPSSTWEYIDMNLYIK